MTQADKAAWFRNLAVEADAEIGERAAFELAERARLAKSYRIRAARERLRVLRDNADAHRGRGEPIDAMIERAAADLATAEGS